VIVLARVLNPNKTTLLLTLSRKQRDRTARRETSGNPWSHKLITVCGIATRERRRWLMRKHRRRTRRTSMNPKREKARNEGNRERVNCCHSICQLDNSITFATRKLAGTGRESHESFGFRLRRNPGSASRADVYFACQKRPRT